MNRKILEQVTLLASVIKWAIYASVVGVLVGGGTTAFLKALAWTSAQYEKAPNYYLLLPVTLVASTLLVRWLAPDAAGHGTEKVIEAVHQRMGKIPVMVVPVKLAATVITLAGGGSAGKEGPCAQIGAGLASCFASLLRLNDVDRRKLVICGISAGFATVFGTPIAGALFGVEVLVLGQVFYDVLFPSFVAGIIGFHVAGKLGASYPHPAAEIIPAVTGWSFTEMILLGIWCGIAALLFIELMQLGHRLFARLSWHPVVKALLGGVLLVLIGRFVSLRYLGLGLDSIDAALNGAVLPAGATFMKMIATSITLGSGGSGGVVTPIFFIGTAAGNLFASLFHEPLVATFSAIGMVALLAGAANTPIAASVMAMELFGAGIAPHAGVACMVSFLIVGYRSIYPSQILGIQKSTSLRVETGRPLGQLNPEKRQDHLAISLPAFVVKGAKVFGKNRKSHR
ncbi:chloride channel protein [Geomonas paludis]|uniref:Chloride channel protein n=1 Tax=Geomonas paludis TaxID=2740185 RepID=A0A6V8MRA0_9BACT|nr:chloride channel protein [Geomonas paludis]UPU35792.1 chloride channel protein [Geomonas paludis]GFO62628.1 permease [Geomonas paludis]